MNQAARLCGAAAAGEVFVGQGIADMLADQTGWRIEAVGNLNLKDFAAPVPGY